MGSPIYKIGPWTSRTTVESKFCVQNGFNQIVFFHRSDLFFIWPTLLLLLFASKVGTDE